MQRNEPTGYDLRGARIKRRYASPGRCDDTHLDLQPTRQHKPTLSQYPPLLGTHDGSGTQLAGPLLVVDVLGGVLREKDQIYIGVHPRRATSPRPDKRDSMQVTTTASPCRDRLHEHPELPFTLARDARHHTNHRTEANEGASHEQAKQTPSSHEIIAKSTLRLT